VGAKDLSSAPCCGRQAWRNRRLSILLLGCQMTDGGRAQVEPFLNLPDEPCYSWSARPRRYTGRATCARGLRRPAVAARRYVDVDSIRSGGRSRSAGFDTETCTWRSSGRTLPFGDLVISEWLAYLTWFIWAFVHLLVCPASEPLAGSIAHVCCGLITGQRASRADL